MGRKRTHHDAKRTKIVSARLTQETYDLISVHAEKLGLTRAGYVEHLIEDRPLRIQRPASDALPVTFLNELKRIGNNLNQIAHARNAGQNVDPRHFQTAVTEIIATICSNEVLRRRYEQAEDEVRRKGGDGHEEAFRLRQKATTSPTVSPKAEATPGLSETKPEPHPSHERRDEDTGQDPREADPPKATVAPLLTATRELRLSEDDVEHRLWPPRWRGAPPSPIRSARNDTTADQKANRHGPKTSSSWFKLPWRL